MVVDLFRHPLFERHGDDLFLQLDVPMTAAILGGEVEVPTLGGQTSKLVLAEGTQTGSVLRIDGQGVPHLQGRERGDEYVIVKATVPTGLTDRQKKLIQEFEKIERQKRNPKSRPKEDLPAAEATTGL